MPQSTISARVRRRTDVLAIMDDKSSLDDLDGHQKTSAFNALEWIKATVNSA